MSKRKQWKSEEKARIILSGLQGRPVSEICIEYGISNSQYYKWKDQFMRNMHLSYEVMNNNKSLQRLKSENSKLKTLVADLSLEIKKSDW
jgi:transposase-like protein